MRWRKGRRSTNIEDRRGRRVAGGAKISGGVIIIALILSFITGQNPLTLLQQMGGVGQVSQAPSGSPVQRSAADQEKADFVAAVLGYTEDVWGELFASAGQQYKEPGLVLFDQAVESACGLNSAAVGPFYCPGDHKVYLELGFFQQLARMGAPGEFAQAYVIGHEVGHHIQNITGIEPRVRQLRRSAGTTQGNQLSVLMELQADCLAGVWAHHANRRDRILEPGDVEEGLQAAASIGDDRLMAGSGKVVRPESFTHGSSAQRVEWLKRGLRTGDFDACDTFGEAGVRL
ncbi:MAG: neutral zinc metallopeptidase [Xanthomonadales bacterium]|nr:neutral zinc metallopeptidase [Xanthomonadales bacterium]